MTDARKPRIAVLFGGRSSEHAVSCVTAAGVLGAIDRDKYDVIPIGIAKTGQWVLPEGDLDQWSLTADALPEVTPGEATVALAEIGGEHQLIVAAPDQVPTELGQVDVVFRSCTDPSARTERSRACWSSATPATWAPACWPRPSAWTSTS